MPAYAVIWSPIAKFSYFEILEYLEKNWTIKEIAAFTERTEQVIEHISDYPLHYPYSKESNSYRSVFISQVSLFYRITGEEIELLVFWNNRQNPAKLKL